MQYMNARVIAPTLPLPEAAKELAALWLTRKAAAKKLGVDPATISRWAATGIITAYYPSKAPGERPDPLFYVHQVDELVRAKALLTPNA